MANGSKRVMSGMRPTGRLHLGHYWGVLQNWVQLQNQYDCYFSIADWHALTTKAWDTAALRENTLELALDWLAAGVDPGKATLFVQSSVPQVAELHVLLSMVTPVKWVETDPTLKDMVAMARGGNAKPAEVEAETSEAESKASAEALSYGLLGYPVLQTADILSVGGELVPVGKDQLAHLEISRDIARRLNHLVQQPLFVEPRPLLTELPLVQGLDGRKMGKSYDNAIFLADTADETAAKLKAAITDAKRVKKTDPGEPKDCLAVFPLYESLAAQGALAANELDTVASECRAAERGCMACKKQLTERLNEHLQPLRTRRAELAQDLGAVTAILSAGSEKAQAQCDTILSQLRQTWRLNG